jgi:hypothetical protein
MGTNVLASGGSFDSYVSGITIIVCPGRDNVWVIVSSSPSDTNVTFRLA